MTPVRCDNRIFHGYQGPRFIVGVQTWNPLSTLRIELLEQTVDSALDAFRGEDDKVVVFDNASTDGSWPVIEALGERLGQDLCVLRRPTAENTTPGAGRNALLAELIRMAQGEPAIIVMSDDDMLWRSGSGNALHSMWNAVHEQVAVIGGLLEPLYDWNAPRFTIEAKGGRYPSERVYRALVRDTIPGAAVSLYTHSKFWRERLAGPWFEERFGYDVAFSRELWEEGFWVAQMDLAEHAGWEASTHGNRANQDMKTRPLDREKWGV